MKKAAANFLPLLLIIYHAFFDVKVENILFGG